MFKISPVQDQSTAEKYLAQCGANLRSGSFVYAMTDVDTGDVMGIAQFEITDSFGFISDLRPAVGTDDFEAMFILGRQTMNFIDACGMHICRADNVSGDQSLMKAIGFREDGDGYYRDMTGMFDGNCGCH
ncbi:MAG: hypothetical protein E7617_04925 [Ruminococcaceae bacterium]|nr:hypothetical protein [Oscillospiraceae bacterium]